MAKDGVSEPAQGKGESGGGAWKGGNDKPSNPDGPIVTHNVTEAKPARDRDRSSEADRAR